jgi:hypothetical protein
MENFINPRHPAIRKLASKLEDKEPVEAELSWIGDNISYGMERCLDLELELKEPVGLRKDYDVLQTREGICTDQSFLLASLLRNRMPSADIKLVHVASEKSYEEYMRRIGSFEELGDPYDHICVGIINEGNVEILDPVAGKRNVEYKHYYVADDYTAFLRLYEQRNLGMVSILKSGWIPLVAGIKNNKILNIYATLVMPKFYRMYTILDYGLMETWDLAPSTPEIVDERFVKLIDQDVLPISENELGSATKKLLKRQVQGRSFVEKLKKMLDRPPSNAQTMYL